MFESLEINIADQWVDTSLGNILEASIFYEKVKLITPVSRLSDILAQNSDGIDWILELIEGGHLDINIEQLPAGEIANDLGLLIASGTGSSRVSNIAESMKDDFKIDHRFFEAIFIQVLRKWGLHDHRSVKKVENLAEKLITPNIANHEVQRRLDHLKGVLDFCKNGLLQKLLVLEFGAKRQAFDLTGETEINGVRFPIIRTPSFSPAFLIEAISFAGFLKDQAERARLDDVFTSNRFNEVMKEIYGRSISRMTGQYDVDVFQAAALEAPPIRELFDAGELKRKAIMKALDRKHELLKHTRGKPDDIGLARWYFENRDFDPISGTTLRKTIRFGTFTGAGLSADMMFAGGLGTVAGVAIGGFDAFILDKLRFDSGPRTFVEGPLMELVTKNA